MIRIIGFAGSLRSASYNAALLREAAQLAPPESAIDIVSIRDVPLYDQELEESAFPAAVAAIKDRIASADGLLIATPEYNNSLPGVAKNAVDWLSRPSDDSDRVFKDLPVAVMGASPGRWGTRLAQNAWLSAWRTLGVMPYFDGRLEIGNASRVFDSNGHLIDDAVRTLLREFVEGFVAFAARYSRLRSRDWGSPGE